VILPIWMLIFSWWTKTWNWFMTEKSLCLCRSLFVVIHHLILIMVAGKAWNRIRGKILECYYYLINCGNISPIFLEKWKNGMKIKWKPHKVKTAQFLEPNCVLHKLFSMYQVTVAFAQKVLMHSSFLQTNKPNYFPGL
jgi:hypothetical protein